MAAVVFVTRALRDREIPAPQRRNVLERLGRDLVQHGRGNADVGNRDGAAMEPARQQKMSGFFAEKRDRVRSLYRNAEFGARGAVDAARQVHRIDRRFPRVDGFDQSARRAFHRTIEARSEQRVDDDLGAGQCSRRRGSDRPGPLLRGARRIAFEPADIAQQHDLDARAALGQEPRGNKTIAAVIARPGDNDDPAAGRMARGHGLGHGATGALHQLAAGDPAGDRQPVGVGHLRAGQKLKHAALRIAKAAHCEYRPPLPTIECARPLTN